MASPDQRPARIFGRSITNQKAPLELIPPGSSLPGTPASDISPGRAGACCKRIPAAEAPPPSANSIQFPSLRRPSFTSSITSSANIKNNNIRLSLSTSTTDSSSASFIHHNIRSFQLPPELPRPALRHSSASLSNFLVKHRPSQESAAQDDDGPQDDQAHRPDHPHSTLMTATQIERYLRAQPTTPSSARSPPANSIQFPSSPMSWDHSAAQLADHHQADDPHDAFDRLIHHWLTSHFEPAHSHSLPELVPELDILVGFKAISDRLSLPALERHQVWDALRLVFPSASSWARPTPPGLRSNQEHVVLGIKPKLPASSADHPGRPKTREAPDASTNEQTYNPFDKLDFKKPIPSRIHSTELIEHMRQRICQLEPIKPNPKLSRMPFSKAKSTTRPSQAHSSKKHYHAPLRLFRLDPRRQPLVSDESGQGLLNLLGHRIWTSLIQACKNTKDDFQAGEILVASWLENMNKFEFDLICRNSKSSETQITETTSKKIVKIAYPFQKKHQVIKLFKSQPFEAFNSIIFSDDRGEPKHTGSSAQKVALKDFTIVQISVHPVLNRDQKREQSKFSSLSKGTFSKILMNSTARDDKKSDRLDIPRYEKRRGQSLDLINNPMIPANPGPLMELQTVLEYSKKEARPIGSFFGQINQNFQQKRKSLLTLDKIFNHQHQQHVKQASPDPADLILAYNSASSSSDTPVPTLILQEIAIEFNLLCLNQLKIQIKLLQHQQQVA